MVRLVPLAATDRRQERRLGRFDPAGILRRELAAGCTAPSPDGGCACWSAPRVAAPGQNAARPPGARPSSRPRRGPPTDAAGRRDDPAASRWSASPRGPRRSAWSAVGTPARSLSKVRSRISPGGVSSMNWTNGSMASENWTRCGIGMVNFSVSAVMSDWLVSLFQWTQPLFYRSATSHSGGRRGSEVDRRRSSGAVSVGAETSCRSLSYD